MIFKDQNNIEIDSDIEGLDATIEQENLPILFEIMSKSLYSNSIGSLIREITSNCFDSHIEANVKDAVVISKKYNIEDNNYSIIFEDFGVGLSTDRVLNIYMKYFSSTKRTTNELIGGFGLGSKSPLSYQDYFYINTYYNGLEYNYIYSKGEKLPQLISLNGYIDEIIKVSYYDYKETNDEIGELKYKNVIKKIPIGLPTNKRNGTQIIVTIKSGDLEKFKQELKQQLAYFDNVHFDNWNLPFVYNIYNYEYFKYRTVYQYSTTMHIVLGKVAYPINWSKIGMLPIEIPIGIKFDIGELSVTPNREEIRYEDNTDLIIKEKISKALVEINNLFNTKSRYIDNYYNYIKELSSSYINIKFGDENVQILSSYFTNLNYIYGKSEIIDEVTVNTTFLERIPSSKIFEILYEYSGIIKSNKIIMKKYIYLQDPIPSNTFILDSESNLFTNRYINTIYTEPKSIKKLSIRFKWKQLNDIFDFYIFTKKSKYLIEMNQERNSEKDSQQLLLKDYYYDYDYDNATFKRRIPYLGKALIMYKAIKHFRTLIENECISYKSYTPSKEWIDNYKLEHKKEKKILKGSIYVTQLGYKKREIKLQEIADYKHVIYAIDKESKYTKLSTLMKVVSNKKSYLEYYKNNKNAYTNNFRHPKLFLFIELSKVNFDIIKDFPNLTHIDFIKYNKEFKKINIEINTIKLIRRSFVMDISNTISDFSDYYNTLIKKLQNYINKYNDFTISNIIDDITYDKNIISELKYLEKELINTHKFKYLRLYNIPEQSLKGFIKNFKILKLDEKWYTDKVTIKEKIESNKLEFQKQMLNNKQIQLF